MRRRIVEVPRHEVGRFRREAVAKPEPRPQAKLGATLGERAIARQISDRGRHLHMVIIDDPIKEAGPADRTPL